MKRTRSIRTAIALTLALVAILATTALASAGTVTSERVIFGSPYGTVRLDEGRDYTEVLVVPDDPATIEEDESVYAFVALKSFDQMCKDARNPFRRYKYTEHASGYPFYPGAGPTKAWNGHYYITCTN